MASYGQENFRRKEDMAILGNHISIKDLKAMYENRFNQYLNKTIPDYPSPVEFHLTYLTHVTNKASLMKIWDSEGFKAMHFDLLWWSLKVNDVDVRAAEERFLQSRIPEKSPDRKSQEPFLRDFTTSPAFNNDQSRYGNFQFTFPVTELMEAYKVQFCHNEDPVLRVYMTRLYKQEIQYVVLVHSPQQNQMFSAFPELSSRFFVLYDNGQIIWRAQAICETHYVELKRRKNNFWKRKITLRKDIMFYVWDHVSFAFHMDKTENLRFSKKRLLTSLTCCKLDKINLSIEENCSLEEAEKIRANLAKEVDEDEVQVMKSLKSCY